jgi:hypothetical protein
MEARQEAPPLDDENDLLDIDEDGPQLPVADASIFAPAAPSGHPIHAVSSVSTNEPRRASPHMAGQATAETWDDATPSTKRPDTLSPAQLQRLHILGKEAYGAEWKTVAPRLVHEVSNGALSSKDLSPDEADVLIADLQKLLKKRAQNGVAA